MTYVTKSFSPIQFGLQASIGVLLVAEMFGPRWQEVGLPYKIPIACVGCGSADKVMSTKYFVKRLIISCLALAKLSIETCITR